MAIVYTMVLCRLPILSLASPERVALFVGRNRGDGGLLAGVVAVAGLDVESFLFGDGEVDLVVAVGGGGGVGGVAESVLGTKLFGDLGVDARDILFFRDLEEAAAGFAGDAFEDLFAVDAGLGVAAAATALAAAATAASGIASAATGVAAAGTAAVVAEAGAVLLALEVDGVDDGIGALGGLDGMGEGLLAGVVDAVREDDEGFAAVLLGQELIGAKEDGVVHGGAAAAMAAATTVAAATAAVVAIVVAGVVAVVAGVVRVCGGVGVGVVGVWGVDLFEGGLELGAGGGEVLEELDGTGELDDEGLIGRAAGGGGEHGVEEGAAGGALLIEDVALGGARINEEAEGKGEVVVAVKVADGLRVAVDGEGEVGLGEVPDEGSFFVADDDGEVDEAGVDGEMGGFAGGGVGFGWLGLLGEGGEGEGGEGEGEGGEGEGERETGEGAEMHVRVDV